LPYLVQIKVGHVVGDVEDKQIAAFRAFVAVGGLDGGSGSLERARVPSIGLKAVFGVDALGQCLLLGEKGVLLLLRLFQGRMRRKVS
jgi:hypothetical protein